MSSTASRVVFIEGETAQGARAYHRDFPEIRADGSNHHDAASHLANQLTRALDSALTDWRRETLNAAIADVHAYTAQSSPST